MERHPGRPEAVIVAALRSPLVRGRRDGAFAGLHPVDLLAQVLDGLVTSSGIDPAEIDDVIAGATAANSCAGRFSVRFPESLT
jgi:acetyl-CoA acyltransferase